MKIFITGASGYVGHRVLEELLHRGHEVTALERSGSKRKLTNSAVRVVEGDVRDADALARGMESCDGVVHLVGIIREDRRHGVTMQAMHVEATAAVVGAAKAAGVKRMSYMSALGARPNATSSYHKTKWDAEEIVRQSGLEHTIFEPSVIFGQGGPGPTFVSQLADLVRKSPVVPIIGDGRSLLQPVSIDTVAAAFADSIVRPRMAVYQLGGPEVLPYAEILRRIAAAIGKKPRYVHVPLSLMKRVVPVMQGFSAFPITTDQLTMLVEGNVCHDAEAAYKAFDLPSIPFSAETCGA